MQKFQLLPDRRDSIVSDSVEDTKEEKISEPEPLEVTIKNPPKKEVQWNDSHDDVEYEDLGITEEDMDI